MKKSLFCVVAACVVFAGCASDRQPNSAAFKQQLANACLVVQPTLTSIQEIEPGLAPFVAANGQFCASINSVDTTSVLSMVNTTVPAAVKLVGDSKLLTADAKVKVIGALTAFQVALSTALVVYGQPAPATGASAPVGASA